LLLFRLLYYIAPFILAVIVLGIREIVFNMAGTRKASRPSRVEVSGPLRSEIEKRVGERDGP
jgi:hypothetical protein